MKQKLKPINSKAEPVSDSLTRISRLVHTTLDTKGLKVFKEYNFSTETECYIAFFISNANQRFTVSATEYKLVTKCDGLDDFFSGLCELKFVNAINQDVLLKLTLDTGFIIDFDVSKDIQEFCENVLGYLEP